MARRGGKAATRRSRQQRRAQRAQTQPRPEAGSAPGARELDVEREPAAAGDAPAPVDAFEAADAQLRASTPPPGSRADVQRQSRRTVRARTGDFTMTGGSSRLSERAAAEYHYVGRDLRNIGILLVVMVVLLAASAVVVNVLGIGV